MKKKRKRFHIMIYAIAVTIAMFAAGLAIKHSKPSDDAAALTVNGEPVTVREFRAHLNYAHVAQTYSYFKNKYGADAGTAFWTTIYGGEQPIRYAREATLQDEVRIKVQQMLMKQNGIIGDAGYNAFLKQWSDENSRRQEAVKKGQVVIGPTQFGENEYFDYQFGNNVAKLKEKWVDGTPSIPEADLKAKYESDKDKKYKLPDYTKLAAIRIMFDGNDGNKEQAEQQITAAKRMLDSGEAFELVAKQFNKDGKPEELDMDETTARNDELMHPELKAAADRLQTGESSGVIAQKGEFDIVTCIEKATNRYRTLDEVRQNVRSDYIDEKYGEMVDKLVREAKVEINHKVYDKIFP